MLKNLQQMQLKPVKTAEATSDLIGKKKIIKLKKLEKFFSKIIKLNGNTKRKIYTSRRKTVN